MRKIPLSKGKYATVDDADYKELSQHRWYLCAGYAARWQNGTNVLMHRIITGAPQRMDVDHKNHDKLDNRRGNLRVCSRSSNVANGNPKAKRGKYSKYRGVSYYKRHKKWTAQVCKDYKLRHLGRFDSELEAAKAYNVAAKQLFGEYAQLNQI